MKLTTFFMFFVLACAAESTPEGPVSPSIGDDASTPPTPSASCADRCPPIIGRCGGTAVEVAEVCDALCGSELERHLSCLEAASCSDIDGAASLMDLCDGPPEPPPMRENPDGGPACDPTPRCDGNTVVTCTERRACGASAECRSGRCQSRCVDLGGACSVGGARCCAGSCSNSTCCIAFDDDDPCERDSDCCGYDPSSAFSYRCLATSEGRRCGIPGATE